MWVDADEDEDGGGRSWPVGSRLMSTITGGGDGGGVGQVGDPIVVADPQGLVAAPTATTGPDDAVWVAYYRLPNGVAVDAGEQALVEDAWDLMVARRPVGAEEFERQRLVAEMTMPPPSAAPLRLVSTRGIAAPGLAAGDARLCVAWTDLADGAVDAHVKCLTVDELEAAQTRQPVSLGADLADIFQWLPQLAIDESGRVGAVFYHHRQDADDDTAVDAYYATSADPHQEGFADSVRLSSRSHTPRQAPVTGWFGTQLGLTPASDGRPVVAVWADSRHAWPDAFTSQTLWAATINPPDEPGGLGSPAPAGWAGAALTAVGLLAVGAGVAVRRRQRQPDGPAAHALRQRTVGEPS